MPNEDSIMPYFNIVAQTNENTVVTGYEPVKKRSDISNGTNTRYYSNSTRYNAIGGAKSKKTKKEETGNSFEFTSFRADANNRVITDLIDFTRTASATIRSIRMTFRSCRKGTRPSPGTAASRRWMSCRDGGRCEGKSD